MAWRNIWRNKMRSVIIMLSLSLGLFAGIAVMALYKGMMKSRVRIVIDAETGHLQLHESSFKNEYEPRYILPNGEEVLQSIRGIPGIKSAVPRSITNGMLATTAGTAGVQINGVIPALEYDASQLKKKIVEGTGFDSTRRYEVMIGRKLAKKMRLKPRSKLVLTFTDTSGTIVSGAFRVAAVYQSNNAPLDERNVYVRLNEMNELLGTGAAFHEIGILLGKDDDVKTIQADLKRKFPALQIESWMEISPETDLMVNTVDIYSYIIMIIIMLALVFGIINTMLMAILERTKEIGMMVALGTNKRKIFSLVLLETLILTLAGTPVGIAAGWLATEYFGRHGINLAGMREELMSSFGFSATIYPEFPAEKLAGILFIVICTAFLACLFPAAKALRLKPVEALKR